MSAADSLPQYTVHDGDVERDREAVLSIWRGNLGQEDRMAAKYAWFYLGCPYGPPLLQLLQHTPSTTWVGVCSMGRRRMLWEGREIRTGVLVDLAVLPKHRSLGPALMLQQGVIDSVRDTYDMVLGFPNPKAAAVFRRIRYSKFRDIVRYAKILRHGDYLRRRLPDWIALPLGALADAGSRVAGVLRSARGPRLHAQWSERADPRMDELWARSEHGNGLVAIRDAQFVRWRFDESPLGRTRHLLLSEQPGGPLSAWFTAETIGGVLQVKDFWSIDAAAGVSTRYINALLRAARMEGHSAVSVEMATTTARLASWASRGFLERNRRPVFGYWSQPPNQVDSNLELHLTAADEDE